jgi:SAM-dependent methyltransferase
VGQEPVVVIPVCRVCGSSESVLISRDVAGAPESAVYRCEHCTLIYLFPIMAEEEEANFYWLQFERYMEDRSSGGWKSPEVHFRSYQAEGERRLPLVRPHLLPDDTVLEIGSSTGYFLEDLRGYVRSVTGVEPGRTYRAFAVDRGIETVPALEDVGQRTFDVIALYYVLEHLRDPVGYLTTLRARLNPGGRLLIEVPNVDDTLLSVYRIPGFPPFYWQKAHYHYFSHRTLTDVLHRAGYSSALSPVQRYDLSNHMVWMMEGKPGGMGRFKHLFTAELESAYAEALKAHWVCDTLFAVGRIG